MAMIWVFLGGGVGASFRYGLSFLSQSLSLKVWMGTFMANLIGCSLYYCLSRFWPIENKSGEVFIKVGILGSLTTFSTFSYEVVSLFKQGHIREGFLVLFLNVFFGIMIGVGILR